jgi:fibronectin-binding autotransporter adhesin
VLLIKDSGVLSNADSVLGRTLGSSNNVATVTGSHSVWKSPGGMLVGDSSTSNQLIIADGGTVVNDNGHGFIGYGRSSSNNIVVVSGGGSVWSNRDLQVGVDQRSQPTSHYQWWRCIRWFWTRRC